jgi:hypothetical protein
MRLPAPDPAATEGRTSLPLQTWTAAFTVEVAQPDREQANTRPAPATPTDRGRAKVRFATRRRFPPPRWR